MTKTAIKQWLRGAVRSAAMWMNSVVGSIALSLPYLQEQAPSLEPYLPANPYKWLVGTLIVANILLRAFKTKTSIMEKGAPKP
jgi:uncharacterized membrane protein YdcZ (DUF606 family)